MNSFSAQRFLPYASSTSVRFPLADESTCGSARSRLCPVCELAIRLGAQTLKVAMHWELS